MPPRARRTGMEFDPNKSDSEDETYGVSPSKKSKPHSSKSSSNRRAKKRRRRAGYDGGDSSDDDEISDSELDEIASDAGSEEEEDEDEVEIGPSGRPRRRATKDKKPIIESESDSSAEDEDSEEEVEAGQPDEKRSLWVTLPANPGSKPGSSHRQRASKRSHGNQSLVAMTKGDGATAEASKRPRVGGKGPQRVASEEEVVPSNDEEQQSTDELQQEASTREVAASREDLAEEAPDAEDDVAMEDASENTNEPAGSVILDSGSDKEADNKEDDDDDDDDPIAQGRRSSRRKASLQEASPHQEEEISGQGTVLGKRKSRGSQKSGKQESSDFEPMPDDAEEDEMSDSGDSASPQKQMQDETEDSSPVGRGVKRQKRITRSRRVSDEDFGVPDRDELLEEVEELQAGRRSRRSRQFDIIMEQRSRGRRSQNKVNYDIMASNAAIARAIEEQEDEPTQSTPSKRGRGAAGFGRSLFSTYGPFGGGGGAPPVLGGPHGYGAVGGAESDSSDDEVMQRPKPVGVGGTIGMTPTTGQMPQGGLFPAVAGQVHGADPVQGPSGTPANLGKIKDKQALADADPLGVDQHVNFDGVGGLQGHIDQLKEMVALPLLYPEVFQRFHVTPPRGVLFHGPPGTGKTLLARALANSVSSQGKKVTFYMRKGADALSKWVGEAERQLRLLFEEARKNQPSIIFFDEIDGLAPVRSSKQEQIHASIVSTLLALMDGMDGRGQVIVIGATNRPDSVDPALRRPGRFDREFYFPLPNLEARRAILDIHTKGWNPPLAPSFKAEIAKLTKGYGGADLRALCTEAALNAVQRRYPQIYKSNEKLQIKPETIDITAKDFMISVKKMVPSSERSSSSGAAPLPPHIEPLLREPLKEIKNLVDNTLPRRKALTALEEAEFEDSATDRGIKAEQMLQEFDRSRVFRPRLLIRGPQGMGQQYLTAALLNYFEGLHVQAFDLPTLLSDSTRSSEAAIVQFFTEVRRHKPSVIYIPHVDTWYQTVGPAVIATFRGLLRSLAPTDPILLLGVVESEESEVDSSMIRDLFGVSRRHQYQVSRPSEPARRQYFDIIVRYLRTSPDEFPEPHARKKRVLEELPLAPPEAPKAPTPLSKAEVKAQKKKDRLLLNHLKIRIQPVMDHIKNKYRKFRLGVIDEKEIRYLFDEGDPDIITSDLPLDQRPHQYRPYEKAVDEHGEPGLKEMATGKFFYNLDVATIEKRLSNGYYKRPKDFLSDVKKLTKDAKAIGDEERLLKANELQANVEVDMNTIEMENPPLAAELENVYQREVKREREAIEKARQQAAEKGEKVDVVSSNVPPEDPVASSTDMSSGPIKLGQPLPNGFVRHPVTPSNPSIMTNGLSARISDLSDLHGNANTNGTSLPSREGVDLLMDGSEDRPSSDKAHPQDASFGPSAQKRPPESYTGGPMSLEQRKSIPNSLTQGSAVTPMAPGSQAADYTNYASTTSSDKRHTNSSGEKEIHTQSSGKVGPDLSVFMERTESGSQIADTAANTQGSQESPVVVPSDQAQHASSQHSGQRNSSQPGNHPEGTISTPAVPLFSQDDASKTKIQSLLNNDAQDAPTGAEHKTLKIDKEANARFLNRMVELSDGCSVEQLEQLYSAMMSQIWEMRGEWDRAKVAVEVEGRFVQEVEDIQQLQGIGYGSMDVDRLTRVVGIY